MASRTESPWLDPSVARYVAEHAAPADAIAQELIEQTSALGGVAVMQIAADQAALVALLVRLVGARAAIEIGTFTGYSALTIARALPDDGHLLCLDVSDEWTSVGRPFWARAGVSHKIELRIGKALDTLAAMPAEPRFDLAFIDADKPSYLAYLEALLPRLRPGALVLVDNTLWSGQVLDPAKDDRDTVALRAFNDAVAADPRLESYLLPVADGLTLIRPR